jgi:thymidylate synthase
MHMMALPPCHWGFNVVVYGGRLNLVWHQRSADLLLGVGANIASYGLLLLLLAEEAGLKPGELVGTLADCHIYCNLLDNARELVKREENTLPTVKIKRKNDGSFSIFDWTWDDVELIGYDPHPAINMGSVTV